MYFLTVPFFGAFWARKLENEVWGILDGSGPRRLEMATLKAYGGGLWGGGGVGGGCGGEGGGGVLNSAIFGVLGATKPRKLAPLQGGGWFSPGRL